MTAPDPQAALAKERQHINELDTKIAALLAERFQASQHIAALKGQAQVPVLDEKREQQVLDHAAQAIGDEKLAAHAKNIFTAIMKASRAVQRQQLQAKKA